MPLTHRENFLRNASMEGHEWIPQGVFVSRAMWLAGGEALEDICTRHPVLFPGFRKGQIDYSALRAGGGSRRRTDAWGCVWEYELDGLEGIVVDHPLDDWGEFDAWQPPQPPELAPERARELAERASSGELRTCGSEHGFLFMRLYYLRGYANFMVDVAEEDPRLDRLVDTVTGYWEQAFAPYISAGIDVLRVADDLGTQTGSMLGPTHFRRWLLPAYSRLFAPALASGAHVAMHHDGYIMDIMDEIIESGVTIVNPQDLVNGIDNLQREVKGRACIDLDIDRQRILPFGSPADIRDLVREAVLKLGSPRGGLQMTVGLYPPTPLENIEALLDALEEHRTYWVGR